MGKAQFDINPHVIRQLGAELVSDNVTALLELIKNSYDADATYVNIEINTTGIYQDSNVISEDHKGYIVVEDNGFGMDEETLLKSWLIISYSKKRAVNGVKPKTPKGRTPLGDKGLGRLSTQRLANRCEIFTKKQDSEAFHVGFKWSDFDKVERLSDVNVDFKPVVSPKSSGTKMVLMDLVNPGCWKDADLERLKGALCQIIAPYKELKPFNIYLTIDGEIIDISQEISKLEQLNLCDINFAYEKGFLNVHVDVHLRKLIGNDYETYKNIILPDNGKRFEQYLFQDSKGRGKAFQKADDEYWLQADYRISLERLNTVSYTESQIDDPCDFKGRIQEFYFGAQDKEGDWWNELYKNFKEYKSFVQSQTGIKIYRNGFAVRPYGINNNDWLQLGQGQTGGSSYYGLRPGNVVGYVAIDEAVNCNLKDKTDREGLIENGYYLNFCILMQAVVDRYAEIMENLRRCYADFKKSLVSDNKKVKTMTQAFKAISEQAQKGLDTQKAYKEVQNKFVIIEKKISTVVRSQEKSLFDTPESDLLRQTLTEVSQILSESRAVLSQANEVLSNSNSLNEALIVIEPKLSALEAQLNDFSELASLGLISEMVTHDLCQISNRLLAKGQDLNKQLKDNVELTKNQLYGLVDFINSVVTSLRSQMRHLDPSLKYNREVCDTFSIVSLLKNEEIPYYEDRFKKYDIDIVIEDEKDFSIMFNKGRFMQIFDNLINNSIYWLINKKESKEQKSCIMIRVDSPWVYFEDNGDGIDNSVSNTLFEPFVTRKPRGEGRGLGLFIIRQLLDTYKCDIVLDDSLNIYGNRYRFSLNFNEVISK